ncbi:hypothetical protein HOY80DRAFT_1049721 [Tuber brumale]|nr:hypothetical protein HOY80DRAFT_1049721 [Tuber brumale]
MAVKQTVNRKTVLITNRVIILETRRDSLLSETISDYSVKQRYFDGMNIKLKRDISLHTTLDTLFKELVSIAEKYDDYPSSITTTPNLQISEILMTPHNVQNQATRKKRDAITKECASTMESQNTMQITALRRQRKIGKTMQATSKKMEDQEE